MIAVSAGIIFARLAMIQELNPFFWGTMAIAVYAGPPFLLISRGAGLMDAPMIWLSSFIGLFVLFIAQAVVAHRKRFAGRSAPTKTKARGKKKSARPRDTNPRAPQPERTPPPPPFQPPEEW